MHIESLADRSLRQPLASLPILLSVDRGTVPTTNWDAGTAGLTFLLDTLDGPLAVMAAEHGDAGAGLDAITQLTDKFTPPEGACRSVTALWDTLRLFDLETRRHIHLESHVLFPAFDNH